MSTLSGRVAVTMSSHGLTRIAALAACDANAGPKPSGDDRLRKDHDDQHGWRYEGHHVACAPVDEAFQHVGSTRGVEIRRHGQHRRVGEADGLRHESKELACCFVECDCRGAEEDAQH